MNTSSQAGITGLADPRTSEVSWPAIAAGAVTAAAFALLLVALGAGLALSSISPWSGVGVSATTFKVGSGIYLLVVAVMSSSIGGYLTAHLRARWTATHSNEVYFRDTAHGLITWAFATMLSAVALTSATSTLVGGATQAVEVAGGQAAAGPTQLAVDKLFRPNTATSGASANGTESAPNGTESAPADISRLWAASFRAGGNVAGPDRAYIVRVVAAHTGLGEADAQRRVTDVINETKQTIDAGRSAAAQFLMWLTASLLLGAFGASLAAIEGGRLRDGTWNNRVLTPRPL